MANLTFVTDAYNLLSARGAKCLVDIEMSVVLIYLVIDTHQQGPCYLKVFYLVNDNFLNSGLELIFIEVHHRLLIQ